MEWKVGFPFNLKAIEEKLEFRRDKVIADYEKLLESNHKLLVLGESGTSKSTVLMEIVCDYLDEGYWALFNDVSDLTNSDLAVKFIKGLLKGGKKIIVAVDNVQSAGKAAIFNVIESMESYVQSENLRFILTARQPEYDRLCRDIPETYRLSVKKLNDERLYPNFKREIPRFSKDETKGFIKRYGDPKKLRKRYFLSSKDQSNEYIQWSDEELEYFSDRIFRDTNGIALMVKFLVIGEGLRLDVEEKYARYLADKSEAQAKKIETMLVCTLLRLDDFDVTDNLLEKMQLKTFAFKLDRATLYRHYEGDASLGKGLGHWDTAHRMWSLEFLSFMFNKNDEERLDENKRFLWEAIDSVLISEDEKAIISIVDTLIIELTQIPLEEVELKVRSSAENSTCHLSSTTMSVLMEGIASFWRLKAYSHLSSYRNEEALVCCNNAIKISPVNYFSWHMKGEILHRLNRFEEALVCCNNAIKINPIDYSSWRRKGIVLACLNRSEEALVCANELIKMKPNEVDSLIDKAIILDKLNKLEEALECYSNAIEMNPNAANYWYYRARVRARQKNYTAALEDLKKAIDINKNFIEDALDDKDFEAIWNDKRFVSLVSK